MRDVIEQRSALDAEGIEQKTGSQKSNQGRQFELSGQQTEHKCCSYPDGKHRVLSALRLSH